MFRLIPQCYCIVWTHDGAILLNIRSRVSWWNCLHFVNTSSSLLMLTEVRCIRWMFWWSEKHVLMWYEILIWLLTEGFLGLDQAKGERCSSQLLLQHLRHFIMSTSHNALVINGLDVIADTHRLYSVNGAAFLYPLTQNTEYEILIECYIIYVNTYLYIVLNYVKQ